MHFSNLHYFPFELFFFFLLLGALILLIVLIELDILEYAYERIGISQRYIFSLLLLTLLGSSINIPIAQLPEQEVVSGTTVTVFGIPYIIPMVVDWPGTVIAVNLGGAVIPTLLSLYLLVKHRLYARGLMGIAIVAAVSYIKATPIRGLGIAVPFFILPLIAAGVALLLSRKLAPPLAYVSGSLGILIGADLLNLNKIQGLGVPIASIGGAGTFDGIFLTGIVAVLLTSLFTSRSSPDSKGAISTPKA